MKACGERGRRGGREERRAKENGRKEGEERTGGKCLHDGESVRSQSGFYL